MKILINDFQNNVEDYRQIFKAFNYEEDELIFMESFEQCKNFIISQLEIKQNHIDLIITNDSSYGYQPNILKANELSFFKNSSVASYSNRNFRISSIPIVLYQKDQASKVDLYNKYSAIIEKNSSGNHSFMINSIEAVIKKWRMKVMEDLSVLGIKPSSLLNFHNSEYYIKHYSKTFSLKADYLFTSHISNLSLEFIKCPAFLDYDWINQTCMTIENSLLNYRKGYRHHVKYDRKNNENTVLHQLLKDNSTVMLRDIFSSYLHEKRLEENEKESQRCDFILKTQFPEYLKTTFLEVKKENIQLIVDKESKRPRLSAELSKHLGQLWDYKEYSIKPEHEEVIFDKLKYRTDNYDYILLAGRGEEKDKFIDILNKRLGDHYPGLKVYSYEDLERLTENYLNKFNRLSFY